MGKSKSNKRIMTGVLALLLGALGFHKFYLGYIVEGVIMLFASLVTFGVLSPLVALIGLAEGITYLRKTDEEFDSTYIQNKRGWF